MKTISISLGWREYFTNRVQKHKFRIEPGIEKNTLRYDAYKNRYSVAAKSVPPNLFYFMELNARVLIEVWPFIRNSLLDIGCGNKPFALLINSLVRRYVGIDLSGLKAGIHSDVTGDGLLLPFKAESFDTVLSTDMLNEVASPSRLFAEANRVLQPEGHLIVMVPNNFDIFSNRTIYANYTAEGLRYLAEESGFNVVVMRRKGKLLPFYFNMMIQFIYRIHQKILHRTGQPQNGLRHNDKYFSAFLLSLQKLLLKLTPGHAIKADVNWEDGENCDSSANNFHLGYLMVAKKVFCPDQRKND